MIRTPIQLNTTSSRNYGYIDYAPRRSFFFFILIAILTNVIYSVFYKTLRKKYYARIARVKFY